MNKSTEQVLEFFFPNIQDLQHALRLYKEVVHYFNDWLADPEDVQFIRKSLPNIVDDYEIEGWNHLDFVWAYDTKELLYDRMLKLMEKFRY